MCSEGAKEKDSELNRFIGFRVIQAHIDCPFTG